MKTYSLFLFVFLVVPSFAADKPDTKQAEQIVNPQHVSGGGVNEGFVPGDFNHKITQDIRVAAKELKSVLEIRDPRTFCLQVGVLLATLKSLYVIAKTGCGGAIKIETLPTAQEFKRNFESVFQKADSPEFARIGDYWREGGTEDQMSLAKNALKKTLEGRLKKF